MPIYPHIIRLRQPWQRTMQDDGVRYQRRFNCPTGLDQREQVWLVVRGLSAGAHLSCNGNNLIHGTADHELVEADITERLQPSNLLSIDLPGPADSAHSDLPAEVQLEIRLGPASN